VYTKAKLLAEKTTWDFVQNKRKNYEPCFDLSVIIPVVTMGPLLLKSVGSTPLLFLNTIKNSGILENQYKAFCDVRDVALAHYKAAILPDAVDKRHIIVSIRHRILISDWIKIFNEEFNSKGYFSATKFDKYENVFGNLTYDDTNMKEILKIIPHDVRKTIIDMVDSFIKFDIIKKNQ
jgi:nucleoside-diphosphate-sugar epimerase